MRLQPTRRITGLLVVLMLATACESGPEDIRSVADFDARPCLLFTDDAMRGTITEGYARLAGVEPRLEETEEASVGDDARACVYRFQADGTSQVPEMEAITVTIAHSRNGSQPLALCIAAAAQRVDGYRIEQVGDQGCLTPSSDLWFRVGDNYFQVAVVAQPGFDNPIDTYFALSPIIRAVGEGAASRMPAS